MSTDDAFPFAEHQSCEMLTRLTIEQLPRDGSLGRVRKIRKDVDIWQAEDLGDRLFFLVRGEVSIFSGDPQARDILLQAVSVGEPFGELCSVRKQAASGTVSRVPVRRSRLWKSSSRPFFAICGQGMMC